MAFLVEHIWHEDDEPDCGKASQYGKIAREDGEASVNHYLQSRHKEAIVRIRSVISPLVPFNTHARTHIQVYWPQLNLGVIIAWDC